ncbi:hypothetical protein AVEN_140646-1 [Araneus ventricosus]|uniref:Uncharacterized protein n=1 Tax=Araneus ventricosus TaxID=182803 RepID=A0A4Y2C769_ARAVE|nr:hypothetical protein AVEN_140646-1 [Araneus ventricosus]
MAQQRRSEEAHEQRIGGFLSTSTPCIISKVIFYVNFACHLPVEFATICNQISLCPSARLRGREPNEKINGTRNPLTCDRYVQYSKKQYALDKGKFSQPGDAQTDNTQKFPLLKMVSI